MRCGHAVPNVLLIGPPGSGKSLMARRLPSILPDMTLVAPREARNLGIERGLMTLVVVTQWVRADTAQIPPDHSLASRSVVTSTCTPSNGSMALEGMRVQAA